MNKVALITGASRGLGKTLAAFLAGRGIDLIITARGADDLATTAHALEAFGVRIVAIAGDVCDPAHQRRLVDAALGLGRLDLLINNASMLGPSPQPALVDYPLETLEQVFSVNVAAPLGLIQAALPLLRETRGTVVNISCDAAVGGYAGWGGYGASKAALDLLSLTLANELRADNITVIRVDPGDMRTQMHQEAFPGEDISDRPLPEVTLPFWAWLLGQEPSILSGRRFQAQSEHWLVTA
jgi:NAD(P)-dependent dehydrogenase (short-subunit alcohol dehydrogenase family)